MPIVIGVGHRRSTPPFDVAIARRRVVAVRAYVGAQDAPARMASGNAPGPWHARQPTLPNLRNGRGRSPMSWTRSNGARSASSVATSENPPSCVPGSPVAWHATAQAISSGLDFAALSAAREPRSSASLARAGRAPDDSRSVRSREAFRRSVRLGGEAAGSPHRPRSTSPLMGRKVEIPPCSSTDELSPGGATVTRQVPPAQIDTLMDRYIGKTARA